MGHRYYTTVKFPTTAMSVPEIEAAVAAFKANWSERGIDIEDAFTIVYDEQANYGGMDDITDVLNEFQVPYDQHHSESEGSNSVPWTEYVRWDGPSMELSEVEEAEARTGQRLLKLLREGEFDTLEAELEKLDGDLPSDLDDEWQPDQAVLESARADRAEEN